MAFCENPNEGPVQGSDGKYYCPQRIIEGIGMIDPTFVRCNFPGGCSTMKSIQSNHEASYKDVVNFGSHLPTTPEGSYEDKTFLVRARHVKR